MQANVDEPRQDSVLGGLGVSELEERVYELLLERQRCSLEDVSAYLDCSQSTARELLSTLQDKGLVSWSKRPEGFLPTPPQAALEILAHRRHEEVERARLAAAPLVERYSGETPAGSGAEIVEVVPGGDQAAQMSTQLLGSATEEILGFCTPPLVVPDEQRKRWKLAILGRGVRGRAVYSMDALELPGAVEFVETMSAAGEEARTVGELPMNMLVIDRKAGWLPITLGRSGAAGDWVLVQHSSLVDVLVMLFESVWERAVTFPPGAGSGVADTTGVTETDSQILRLLAGGLKDLAVARRVGIAPRTVERRLSRMMDALGAHTRFQAGVEAQRRGWIGPDAHGTD